MKCYTCNEFLVFRQIHGIGLCVHCYYLEYIKYLSSKLDEYETLKQQFFVEIERMKSINEFQLAISPTYCKTCKTKVRELTLDEQQAILDATQDEDMNRYISNLLKLHRSEKVKNDRPRAKSRRVSKKS